MGKQRPSLQPVNCCRGRMTSSAQACSCKRMALRHTAIALAPICSPYLSTLPCIGLSILRRRVFSHDTNRFVNRFTHLAFQDQLLNRSVHDITGNGPSHANSFPRFWASKPERWVQIRDKAVKQSSKWSRVLWSTHCLRQLNLSGQTLRRHMHDTGLQH